MNTNSSSTKTVKIMVKIVIYAVMIMLLLVLGIKGFGFGQEVFSDQGIQAGLGEDVNVSIPKGAGKSEVASILKDNALIENTSVFSVQCIIYEADFYEGTYTLNTSYSPEEIIEALKIKPVVQVDESSSTESKSESVE